MLICFHFALRRAAMAVRLSFNVSDAPLADWGASVGEPLISVEATKKHCSSVWCVAADSLRIHRERLIMELGSVHRNVRRQRNTQGASNHRIRPFAVGLQH